MTSRFSLESDFVDSYTDSFIFTNFKNEDIGAVMDATVYEQCINLNQAILKTANCTSRGQRVQHYISKLGDDYTKIKEAAIGSCSSQLLQAHNMYYNLGTGDNNRNQFAKQFSWTVYHDKANELKECISTQLI